MGFIGYCIVNLIVMHCTQLIVVFTIAPVVTVTDDTTVSKNLK